jgi:hypothetical protein
MSSSDSNRQKKELCFSLMQANTEEKVIKILTDSGYWDNDSAWRYYGDRASNYNTIGNQQGRSDAALVEKLVNSVDARLINECLEKQIDPEGEHAPKSIREAVAKFFDSESMSSNAGLVREWPSIKRTEIAKGITLAATGNKPNKGNPCFIIADAGEGQSPSNIPHTILSLDRDNKVKIPFVQGKFNMGGTGVLEFCGTRSLQLVLSRRNPQLVHNTGNPLDNNWGFTVVRREDPVGGRKTSVFTYLAPVDAKNHCHSGDVLSFTAKWMPIFPEGNEPYKRSSEWGTLIKLYEYSTAGFSGSNILLGNGLMRQLDLLLTDLALPIRLYECRAYSGHAGSFETNLTGIRVRLDDDKGNNLEEDPFSITMNVSNEKMSANIYVFKKGKADTYRSNEGVIFSLNGQTHGYLSKNFFKHKKVGMTYLADSLLVTVDCSNISARSREMMFMPSRDRLRDSKLKRSIESELKIILSSNHELKKLREKRRREEVEAILADEKPLGEILQDLIKDSPALANLFLKGNKLSNPFNITEVNGDTDNKFEGKKHPTYFKFRSLDYGITLKRDCHKNKRARITFETDAENMYLNRDTYPGEFSLFQISNVDQRQDRSILDSWTVNLVNGIATLNLSLPANCEENSELEFMAQVSDDTLFEPFRNKFILRILAPAADTGGKPGPRRRPPLNESGNAREVPTGIDLPKIIKVKRNREDGQKGWEDMDPAFDEFSALRIKHAGTQEDNGENKGNVRDIYDFFVNVDNIYLLSELKRPKVDPALENAKFIYALVLLGLSIINYELQHTDQNGNGEETTTLDERIELFSIAVAPVLIPMINELNGLEINENY